MDSISIFRFSIDKYVIDSLDLDLDGIMDTIFTTDSYGSLLLDNGLCVFWKYENA